jgi:hypothetical protein
VEYLKSLDKYRVEKPYSLGFDVELKDESERTNLECEERDIIIHNLREKLQEVNIKGHGFELHPIPADVMDRYFADSQPSTRLKEQLLCPRRDSKRSM